MKNEIVTDQYIPSILIVDDMPANLKVLGGILNEEGYKIRPVLNGELALQVAGKEKPDLILLDIMMPGMNGYEVCRLLKENPNLCDIPVIFVSALNDTSDIVKAFTFGGVDFITKPFQAEEVKIRVATHLKIRRQSQELLELNATKDKFFSIIAHDLRGAIGAMLQISEYISEKGNVDEETLYSFLKSQKELSENTFQLLENLLNWARLNTNKIEFYPDVLDIQSAIEANIRSLKVQARNKNIFLSIDIQARNAVYADEKLFRLVIRNLVSNAIKFTNTGGQICISTTLTEDNFVTVSVKDSGIGMPPKVLNSLFRMDVKNGRPGTEGESSNGLGLLLCKGLVGKNGGQIWAESEEGKGSSFYFTVPIQAELL